MEATKFNTIVEQLDKSGGIGYQIKNSINHFAGLYESDDGEGTKYREKPKSSIKVLSEK